MFDLTDLQHFHFLRPYWLLIIIPVIIIVKSFSQRDDNLQHWRELMSADILAQLTIKGSNDYTLSPKKLMFILALVASVVLAGPTWRQQVSPFTEDKSPLIIALDVSQTMDQSDVQPSRLVRAKQKIIELLTLRGDAYTALVAYSGSAHIVMPVTNDSAMIKHFLDSLNHSLMPKAGKLPQAVLPVAQQLMQAARVPGTLLLITDGATAEAAQKFSQFFSNQQHQLIVWGFGRVQAEMSDYAQAAVPLQLTQLEILADKSGGRLVLMSHDKQDLTIVNRYIENNLVIVEDSSRPWFDAGYPLVFVIAFLFLFWFRQGWTLQW